MADLSPRDVAVVLRSVGRRVAEAEAAAADNGEQPSAAALAELDGAVTTVAGAVGAPTTGDRATVAAAAADHIERVPASQWTDERIAQLRAGAVTIGKALRTLGGQSDA